jgi:hypothetical protein
MQQSASPGQGPTGAIEDAADRRSEPRYPTDTPAEFTILGSETQGASPAVIKDISRSGLRLRSNRFLTVGVHLRVRMHNTVIFGEVRYSRPASHGEYDSGLKVEQVVPAQSTPVHLREEDLELYAVQDRLPPVIGEAIAQHLAACRPCRIRLRSRSRVFRTLRRKLARIAGAG